MFFVRMLEFGCLESISSLMGLGGWSIDAFVRVWCIDWLQKLPLKVTDPVSESLSSPFCLLLLFSFSLVQGAPPLFLPSLFHTHTKRFCVFLAHIMAHEWYCLLQARREHRFQNNDIEPSLAGKRKWIR